MAILYESLGSFHTGASSYRALVSKRSRGTISLTEETLTFESQKDKVPFHLKLSEIRDFYLKNRFTIPVLELLSIHGSIHTISTLKESKKHFHSSLQMTEDLFRQLTRLIFNKDQIVLFDAIVALCPGSIKNINKKEGSLQGHMFLTENYILFKSFQTGKLSQIEIFDIKQVIMEIIDSMTYVTIESLEGGFYSFLPLKTSWGRFVKDKIKTEKLYDILNQARMYKNSEKVSNQKNEKHREEMIKCLYCGNMIEPEVNLCPFCGNEK